MNNTKTEEIKPDLKRAKDLIIKGVKLVQIAEICSMSYGEVDRLGASLKH